jgi:hypothetical protein
MPAVLSHCPTMGLSVQGWIVDDPTAHPEQNLELYELVTCPACMRIHLVDPKTGEVLGAPVVRTVGYGEAVRTSLREIDDRHRKSDSQ